MLEKTVMISKRGIPVIIYDSECPVCSKAYLWISKNVFHKKSKNVIGQSFKSVFGRSAGKSDKFIYIENGEVYYGSEAWHVILNKTNRAIQFLLKFKINQLILFGFYTIISRVRKIFHKECNCN